MFKKKEELLKHIIKYADLLEFTKERKNICLVYTYKNEDFLRITGDKYNWANTTKVFVRKGDKENIIVSSIVSHKQTTAHKKIYTIDYNELDLIKQLLENNNLTAKL